MRTAPLSALILLLTLTLGASVAAADSLDWSSTPPDSGQVIDSEVMVGGRGTHPLVTIVDPDIDGDRYALVGSVRYEDVSGPGYLEMWSHFADGGSYFSRTLADSGLMAALEGSSAGQAFELPFFLNGSPPPERVEFNLVLPEGGTVWIGSVELVGFGGSGAWWTETQSGLIGAIGGILAGIGGAVVGALSGKRSQRGLTRSILIAGIVAGGVLTIVALSALVASQPRHVWYPLGLLGVILLVVDGLLLPRLRALTEQEELHRISALDA